MIRPLRSTLKLPSAFSAGWSRLRSRMRGALMNFLYMPSTVAMKPNGNRRSAPSELPSVCMYLKFGSFRLIVFVGNAPGGGAGDPAHALGVLFTSDENVGIVPAAVHESSTRP